MLGTLKTLFIGANARAEEQLRDHYSIELIDQKLRESQEGLKAAKLALASLMQRERSETRQIDSLEARIADLTARAEAALADGKETLAGQAAQAIADMENECTKRRTTVSRLEARIMQLRQSVETANRRIIDLKQGAVAARAARREQGVQKRLTRHLGGDSPMDEADALISRVLVEDDPFEQSEILAGIERGLDHTDMAGRMADAGYGAHDKSTAAQVLARLKKETV